MQGIVRGMQYNTAGSRYTFHRKKPSKLFQHVQLSSISVAFDVREIVINDMLSSRGDYSTNGPARLPAGIVNRTRGTFVNRQFQDQRERGKLPANSTGAQKLRDPSEVSTSPSSSQSPRTRRVVLDERLWRKSTGISPWGLH